MSAVSSTATVSLSMPTATPTQSSPVKRLKKPYGKNTSYTPSIKAALNINSQQSKEASPAKEKVAVAEVYDKPDEFEPYTETQLQEKWTAFANSLVDQPALVATLSHFPEIKENFRLLLPIENSYQNEAIQRIKPKLLSFLCRELHNSKIELETYVTEMAQTRRAYTDTDKLKAMAEKNPQILELKKRFNLDFDSGGH